MYNEAKVEIWIQYPRENDKNEQVKALQMQIRLFTFYFLLKFRLNLQQHQQQQKKITHCASVEMSSITKNSISRTTVHFLGCVVIVNDAASMERMRQPLSPDENVANFVTRIAIIISLAFNFLCKHVFHLSIVLCQSKMHFVLIQFTTYLSQVNN